MDLFRRRKMIDTQKSVVDLFFFFLFFFVLSFFTLFTLIINLEKRVVDLTRLFYKQSNGRF